MADTNILWKKEKDVRPQSGTANDQPSENANRKSSEEPPKKKRRVVKPNPDKKFECRYQGCPKTYSRAEHLYRHQLNRKSQLINFCDSSDAFHRYPKDNISLRFPGLSEILRTARSVHSTQGTAYDSRVTTPQTRLLHPV
jgi:hypothetical protein